jgi:diphthine synthase
MVSTTHADLRMRAAARGIATAIIHAASISSAVCGLSGLQNYRFGKSCSVPFPQKNWFPTTPIEVIAQNLSLRLHTLVYLDIQDDRSMTIHEAIDLLEKMAAEKKMHIPLYVGIARAGSGDPLVRAGTAGTLRSVDFGLPLHILIVPAELHDMERSYLEMFAGL